MYGILLSSLGWCPLIATWNCYTSYKSEYAGLLVLHLLLLLNPWAHRQNVASLKVVSATFLLVCFLYLKESTCETRKNAFCFTSKALFVLEIIKFYLFRYSNVMMLIKCLSMKHETHIIE